MPHHRIALTLLQKCTENTFLKSSIVICYNINKLTSLLTSGLLLLWPWKPLQQCPLVWWIFVPSFTEIPPLSRHIASREIGTNRRTDGQTIDRTTENVMPLPPIVKEFLYDFVVSVFSHSTFLPQGHSVSQLFSNNSTLRRPMFAKLLGFIELEVSETSIPSIQFPAPLFVFKLRGSKVWHFFAKFWKTFGNIANIVLPQNMSPQALPSAPTVGVHKFKFGCQTP